ncbi:MAG: hypothetical protein ACC650_11005 [Gammaproteobacteria bacterium]
MKFSNNYTFYPDNRALEQAIAYSISLLSAELAEDAMLDDKVTVADNFLHTRGNFEQHRFSTNILDSAREALEAVLTEDYRVQEPVAWAEVQNSLGNVLAALGQQQRDVDLFEKATQCFNNALEEFHQEKSPLDWAVTQYNLGTVKLALGRQESDSKLLNAAVDAYTNALLEWTREQMPLEWASTMHQLGATFHAYGKLLKGNRNLQKSVVAYKNALAEFDADNYALELVSTHNNRGAVLHHLAQSEENTERMVEAIKSYDTALTVCMEQQLPIHIAVICKVNMATARGDLAEITKDSPLAEEVGDDLEVIIELFESSLQPLCLKHCEEQLNKMKTLNGNG